jgi:hypothetical protein
MVKGRDTSGKARKRDRVQIPSGEIPTSLVRRFLPEDFRGVVKVRVSSGADDAGSNPALEA